MRIDMPTCQYGEENCKKHFDGNCLLKQDLLDERCPIRRTINDVLGIIDKLDGSLYSSDESMEKAAEFTLKTMREEVLDLKGERK